MRCEQWREVLSARLDGERIPPAGKGVDAHLAECGDCRRWLERAAAVTRLARSSPVGPAVDVTKIVLTTSVRPRRARSAWALRWILGVVGVAQLVLALAQIRAGAAGGHAHLDIGLSATPGHLWHESVAWNVAVGAGFLFIAVRRARPTDLLPTLTAFVLVLSLLSVDDLVAGRVTPARLATHGFIVAGYLAIVTLSRPGFGPTEPPAGQGSGRARWRVRFDEPGDVVSPPVARLRLVRRPPAQHHGHRYDQRRYDQRRYDQRRHAA